MKGVLSGCCGDLCIEFDGIKTLGATPELVKLGLGNLRPVGDGSSLGRAKGAIDPDCLEQVLKTKGKWSNQGVCI